ncbi:MAG TPA: uracil-DNA glycosylase [Planctomycetaceae bacterium]|nr:uracil-DNA glycosylase [Planctomycetaceae bacterium]
MAGLEDWGPFTPPPDPEIDDKHDKHSRAPAPSSSEHMGKKTDSSLSPQAALDLLAAEVARCRRCAELAVSRTQTVFGTGNPTARLVFVGEAPGAEEDKQGIPFVGRAGQLLNDIIVKGMRLRREDVYICNILRCRPPENRNPMPDEAARCREFLDRTLDIVAPKFLCCLGSVAARNLLQTESTIGKLRGKVLDYRGIPVVCTYHPAYLLRNPSAKKDTWADIQILMKLMGITPDADH